MIVEDTTARRQQIARILLSVALLALGLYTLQGFLRALAWAGVLAIAAAPFYERVQSRAGIGRHSVLLPLLFTAGAVLIVIVPLTLAVIQIGEEARTGVAMVNQIRAEGIAPPGWVQNLPLAGSRATAWWNANLTHPEDARRLLGRVDRAEVVQFSRTFGKKAVHEAVIISFTLLTLFFLFKDGPALSDKLLGAAQRMFGPAGPRVARQMVASVHGTVDGLILVGLGVGAALGAGYWLAGVPHPVLLGAVTAIAAMIPGGATLVLVLASAIAVAQSHAVAAAVLLGVGFLIIFGADHAIRPALIGGTTRLPFLWVLLGILGGVETFGLLGLFLGPAIMAALILLWREWTEGATYTEPAKRTV